VNSKEKLCLAREKLLQVERLLLAITLSPKKVEAKAATEVRRALFEVAGIVEGVEFVESTVAELTRSGNVSEEKAREIVSRSVR
jgi:hypothetical protein